MWTVFNEAPGERAGDDTLLAFITEHFEVNPIDDWDEFAALTWMAGRPQVEHPFIRSILEWAWENCNDPALAQVPRSFPSYVMHRLADLAIKTLPQDAAS